MKYVKYGHGKWQPVWKISFNMTGSKETLQEVAKTLFTNEELEMLFDSH